MRPTIFETGPVLNESALATAANSRLRCNPEGQKRPVNVGLLKVLDFATDSYYRHKCLTKLWKGSHREIQLCSHKIEGERAFSLREIGETQQAAQIKSKVKKKVLQGL